MKRFANWERFHVLRSRCFLRSVRWDFALSSQIDHFERRPVFAVPSDPLRTIKVIWVVILHRC